jgi:hypothetical protein
MKKIGMTCLAGLLLLSPSTKCAAKQWSLVLREHGYDEFCR